MHASGSHSLLNAEEKEYLKRIAQRSIASFLGLEAWQHMPPDPPFPRLHDVKGVLLRLAMSNTSRRYVGSSSYGDVLFHAVWRLARIAAFEDNRFPPITLHDFSEIDIKIIVFSPLTLCHHPDDIEIGRHGLKIIDGDNSFLMMPHVAVFNKWNSEQFLNHLCIQSGLHEKKWGKSSNTILKFETDSF